MLVRVCVYVCVCSPASPKAHPLLLCVAACKLHVRAHNARLLSVHIKDPSCPDSKTAGKLHVHIYNGSLYDSLGYKSELEDLVPVGGNWTDYK